MNKKGTKIILQHLLTRSPHQSMNRLNMVAASLSNDGQNICDQAYLDNTLSTIYCDFLITKQYRHLDKKPKKLFNEMMFQQNPQLLQLNKPQKENCQLQKKLILTLKKLHESKNIFNVYTQTEEVISQMTPEEAHSCKKYLMYIYKWVLNQSSKANSQFHQLSLELKKAVVIKLCQAHTKYEEQVNMKNQLDRLQVLSKARECNVKGDNAQAKAIYEMVYQDLENDENTRMEALEYLCRNSKQKGDQSYLLGMIIKIREYSGEEKHMRYVQKILSQINKDIYGQLNVDESLQ